VHLGEPRFESRIDQRGAGESIALACLSNAVPRNRAISATISTTMRISESVNTGTGTRLHKTREGTAAGRALLRQLSGRIIPGVPGRAAHASFTRPSRRSYGVIASIC
jgi:hypothetical protein